MDNCQKCGYPLVGGPPYYSRRSGGREKTRHLEHIVGVTEMMLNYMTGESRKDEERRYCRRCDRYRGYVCAEHRKPTYAELLVALQEIAAFADAEDEAGDLDDVAVSSVAIAKIALSGE